MRGRKNFINLIKRVLLDKRLHRDLAIHNQLQGRRVIFRRATPVSLGAGVEGVGRRGARESRDRPDRVQGGEGSGGRVRRPVPLRAGVAQRGAGYGGGGTAAASGLAADPLDRKAGPKAGWSGTARERTVDQRFGPRK